jgi:FkbM family methyltransferase
MLALRLAAQRMLKGVGRAMGLEIRYAFQNPALTDPRVYDRWLPRDRVKTIIDVGANVGQTATALAASFPSAMIYSFEPFPAAFAQLQSVAAASSGRIRAHQRACGDIDGNLDVQVDPKSASQLNRIDGVIPNDAGKSTIRIDVTRLDTFAAENNIDQIDLLKTDTEGFDAKVLAGAKTLLREERIRCVVSEVGFAGDTHHTPFSDVHSILTSHGFQLAGIYEISYRPSLSVDFANVLFVRPESIDR